MLNSPHVSATKTQMHHARTNDVTHRPASELTEVVQFRSADQKARKNRDQCSPVFGAETARAERAARGRTREKVTN